MTIDSISNRSNKSIIELADQNDWQALYIFKMYDIIKLAMTNWARYMSVTVGLIVMLFSI